MSETVVSLTLPDELVARLDRHQEYLARLNPGVPMSRGAAIRALIYRAMIEIEENRPADPERERRLMRTQQVPYTKS